VKRAALAAALLLLSPFAFARQLSQSEVERLRLNETHSDKINPNVSAMLVIATNNAIKTVPYRTMKACSQARDVASNPKAPQSATINWGRLTDLGGPALITFTCIPK